VSGDYFRDIEGEDLELELDPPETPARAVEILPADFPLPRLIKFVPDARKRERLEQAAAAALAVDITAETGIAAADFALGIVRGHLEAVRQDFEEPRKLAHDLHVRITRALAESTAAADAAIKTIGARIFAETRRRETLRRQAQAEADRVERERLERAAAAAEKNSPALAESLRRQAETATAAPVAAETPALSSSVPVGTWRGRPVGTAPEADPNPAIAELTAGQLESVYALLAHIVRERRDITAIELNYKTINARARAEKSVFSLPGFEAIEIGGARAKGGKRL